MKKQFLPLFLFGLMIALTGCFNAEAQQMSVTTDDEWCDRNRGWSDDKERHCEVREVTLSARDMVRVDGRQNGGVSIRGWNRNEMLVRAKISAHARSESRAREIAREVDIQLSGTIQAGGPDTSRRESYGVTYEIFVPRNTDLNLTAYNGGITIEEVSGNIRFDTHNGGVNLYGLAGDVMGETRNGGLSVELTGRRWDGRGLDVETRNGGVKMHIPEDYSAELETGTVNGHVSIDFPITVRGRISKRFRTTLGNGGPSVRVTTTNGGVRVSSV